jgi:uncharacterized protein (DUF58 family)
MSSKTVIAYGISIAVLGLIAGAPFIVMSGAYLALGAVLAHGYAKSATKHLAYNREIEPCECFVGNTVTLKIRIENRKPLPVFWLKCDDKVPGDGCFNSLQLTPHVPGRAVFSNTVHLKWFERVERTFEVSCEKRGVFRLGPVRLTAGDPLGLGSHSTVLQGTHTLTVYPKIVQLQGLPWLSRAPFGVVTASGWLHRDPLAVVGTREYDGSTPANQIAWKATAKTGELRIKELEPTVQSKIVVALNLSTSDHFWQGIDSQALEDAITVAASLCSAMLDQGFAFGLAANSFGVDKGSLFIGPGLSDRHFKRILDSLAHIGLPWMSFSTALRHLRYRISRDTKVLAVMPHLSEADSEHLSALADAGYPVSVILIRTSSASGEAFRRITGNIPVYLRRESAGLEGAEVIGFERIG